MLVTMKTRIGGYRNGEEWPAKGGTIDLPDGEAADLIRAGYAELTEAPVYNETIREDDHADDTNTDAGGEGSQDATGATGEGTGSQSGDGTDRKADEELAVMNMADLLAYVAAHPEERARVIEVERGNKARKTLLADLGA